MSEPEKELTHEGEAKDLVKAGPVALVPAMYLFVALLVIVIFGLWWWLN
jgi:hypothetical protein